MKSEFEKISENLKMELGQFEEKRVEEFKNKLIQYLETLLESQQTVSWFCCLITTNSWYH